MSRKVKRVQERHFSAHHMLIRAASVAIDRAKEKRPGWFYDELSAMTFAALAIEALGNSIGERVIDGWETDFESASPIAKLRLLADRLGVTYDKSVEPWSGAIELVKFRNRVAHAKPQIVTSSELDDAGEFDKRLFDTPKSKLDEDDHVSPTRSEQCVRSRRFVTCCWKACMSISDLG